MSYVTEPMSIARLRQIVNMCTAGLTPAQIARQLFGRSPNPPLRAPPAGPTGVVGGPKLSVEGDADGLVGCRRRRRSRSPPHQGERVDRSRRCGRAAVCSAR
jgi:hypothetical protein